MLINLLTKIRFFSIYHIKYVERITDLIIVSVSLSDFKGVPRHARRFWSFYFNHGF